MKKNYFAILAIALAVVSCSKENTSTATPDDASSAITIDAMIQTRATELSFESGDQIGVSVVMDSDSSTYAENQLMSYDGSVFSSSLLWYSDLSASSTIYAYYPYTEGTSVPTTFTVKADQTADKAYTASDLMGATKTTTPASVTSMTFKHLLSRVVVSVENNSLLTVSSISIDGTCPTATFDAVNMSVEVDSTSVATSINIPLWDDDTYKAIIIPQTVATSFTVTFSDGSTTSIDKGSVTFESGSQYTATVIISSDGDIDVDLSGDIDGWEDGGSIPNAGTGSDDGDVEFTEGDDYFIYDGVTYATVTLSNGSTWMAEPLCYLPAGMTASSDDSSTEAQIWYPYEIDYPQMVADSITITATAAATYVNVLTDDASIKAKGYLYDQEAAFGAEITEENYASFEGTQGICPTGWHIPTRADYLALVGYSNKAANETAAVVDTEALLYDTTYNGGTIPGFNEAGLNWVYSGSRMMSSFTATPSYTKSIIYSGNAGEANADLYGEISMSYYMTSTAYQAAYSSTDYSLSNIQFFGLMSTVTSTYANGRLTLAHVGIRTGQAIRCVKDAE